MSADVARAEAMGAIKVAMVSRRDRILMAALAALLCAAYVSLYRVGNDAAWAVLAVVAGVGVIWFGFTAASSLQWAKSSVVALDEYDGHASDGDGLRLQGHGARSRARHRKCDANGLNVEEDPDNGW